VLKLDSQRKELQVSLGYSEIMAAHCTRLIFRGVGGKFG
jgi:hypothetical protein